MSYKPETLENILLRFPEPARDEIMSLFGQHQFLFRITSPRQTRLGSFRAAHNGGRPAISVNIDLGEYMFLLVFLHELSHLIVWKQYRRSVSPHGNEWKTTYRNLATRFLAQNVFPPELALELGRYFVKTPATFHHNIRLVNILASLEGRSNIVTVNDVPLNGTFTLINGRQFVKIERLRTRFKCYCPADRKYYLVSKSAEIIIPEK